MSNIIFVTASHHLSRYNTNHEIHIDDHVFNSIGLGFWYLYLRQHDLPLAAAALVQDVKFRREPQQIVPWLKSERMPCNAAIVFRSRSIFESILLSEVQRTGSTIREAYVDCYNFVDNPKEARFVVCTGAADMFWTSGLRKPDPGNENPVSRYGGFNHYGKVLTSVNKLFLDGNFNPRYELGSLCDALAEDHRPYKYTALILSDSMCRNLKEVVGGHVISVSGGLYSDMVDLIEKRNINFGDYRVVIVNCGINVVQLKSQSKYDEELEFYEYLEDLLVKARAEYQHLKVIISTPVPQCAIPQIRDHADWIADRLAPTDIWCINWFDLDTPFGKGIDVDWTLYDKFDLFHLSHKGFRVMWVVWSACFSVLNLVPYTLSLQRHTIKRSIMGVPKQ